MPARTVDGVEGERGDAQVVVDVDDPRHYGTPAYVDELGDRRTGPANFGFGADRGELPPLMRTACATELRASPVRTVALRITTSTWFRNTQVRHEGHIQAGGIDKDVTFVDANPTSTTRLTPYTAPNTAATPLALSVTS